MFKFRSKTTKIVMIGLAISYLPLNASLRIQNLQFESAPWTNTPRKKFNNFKHTIL